jgi:hypothetical protein
VIALASVVVGLIADGGLGYQLRLDLSFRRCTDVALVPLSYLCWCRRSARCRPACAGSRGGLRRN